MSQILDICFLVAGCWRLAAGYLFSASSQKQEARSQEQKIRASEPFYIY
jgi:hypothetical protein